MYRFYDNVSLQRFNNRRKEASKVEQRKQPAKMRLVKTSLTVVRDTSNCWWSVFPPSLSAADDSDDGSEGDAATLSPGIVVDVLLPLLLTSRRRFWTTQSLCASHSCQQKVTSLHMPFFVVIVVVFLTFSTTAYFPSW